MRPVVGPKGSDRTVQHRLEAKHPLATVYVYRYTADAMTRYCLGRRGLCGQALGFVEVREPTGECYSGTVSVRWMDGAVTVTDNPPVPA